MTWCEKIWANREVKDHHFLSCFKWDERREKKRECSFNVIEKKMDSVLLGVIEFHCWFFFAMTFNLSRRAFDSSSRDLLIRVRSVFWKSKELDVDSKIVEKLSGCGIF